MIRIRHLVRAGTALALVPLAVSPVSAQSPTAAPEAAADADGGAGSAIIVTGTRVSGLTQADSPTPIKVLDDTALSKVGQPNLNQVLTQLVPSFSAQPFGGDAANLTLSARLRGLSPNHTLVLVNGKRRHGTANLSVVGGPYQGSAAADLDLIAPIAIKRIEVLEQGAAAQYGSDAIAGVINIILKDDAEGGEFQATAGQNYKTGGETLGASANLGVKVGKAGFLNLSLFHRYHDFTQVGGLDLRVTDASGNLLSSLSPAKQSLYKNIPGFPYVNPIMGDAHSNLTNLQYNFGYDLGGGVTAYSFGSWSKRIASARENVRLPDRIVASSVLGVAGTLGAPGSIVFDPGGDTPSNGFVPRIGLREDDYSITGGVRGDLGGFTFDLSGTWGQDKNLIYTLDSANRSLFIDTHFSPTDFYDGLFRNTEWTLNADFTKTFEAGLASPVTLAFGGEYKKNVYEIGAGDAGSIYKEGGQSYPGFRPSDAGSHSRNNASAYVDVALEPVKGFSLDGAVRYEHYSDFGSKATWKATGRYDFSEAVAVRGTVSTGFRAPTLAEGYYSATNVSPTSAFIQLPANSAAAKLIGFQNLRPETSTNYSLGFVFRPAPRLTVTLDAFQVKVKDRILGTGSIFGSGGAVNFPVVTKAIAANGNVLDPTVSLTGINIFTNGADTRTRGVDLVASYLTEFEWGKINWTLSGTWNETRITRVRAAPASLTPAGASGPIALFDQTALSNLETASPRVKLVSGADVSAGAFGATLRGTLYGVTSNRASPNGGTYYDQRVPAAFIVDLEARATVNDTVTLAIGANNLFDKRPPNVPFIPGTTSPVTGGVVIDAPITLSPYGINGGYYYGRVSVKF
ncbi:TonB-dependent receptor [Novosphingobium sp. KCTC 2891]|uniref:TonB-dependent receptor plug domain-containing protein n=1 Tax=Novosphingobium sp. KCTC 2891 TaxID=2989730 RepID=UPI002221CB37|nr:TonB-dependent receptor [Novosphingobium sp. KCTC 2891]MCW1383569.1 TonB-dependent receptor [Novosphingobium sp. KCTC 2891]